MLVLLEQDRRKVYLVTSPASPPNFQGIFVLWRIYLKFYSKTLFFFRRMFIFFVKAVYFRLGPVKVKSMDDQGQLSLRKKKVKGMK